MIYQSERHDSQIKGRHGGGPDNPALVVVLFDRCGNNARDADTITPHDHGLASSMLVEHGGIHGFRVFGAELKNVAHFDATANLQRAFSARAGVAAHDLPDIGKFGVWHIAQPGCSFDVVTVFIGAANKTRHRGSGVVDNHSDGYAYRSQATRNLRRGIV